MLKLVVEIVDGDDVVVKSVEIDVTDDLDPSVFSQNSHYPMSLRARAVRTTDLGRVQMRPYDPGMEP